MDMSYERGYETICSFSSNSIEVFYLLVVDKYIKYIWYWKYKSVKFHTSVPNEYSNYTEVHWVIYCVWLILLCDLI